MMPYNYIAFRKRLASRIHELRLARRWTFSDMLFIHRFHPPQWTRIERGDTGFSLKTLLRLADVFNMTVDELLAGLEDEPRVDKEAETYAAGKKSSRQHKRKIK